MLIISRLTKKLFSLEVNKLHKYEGELLNELERVG